MRVSQHRRQKLSGELAQAPRRLELGSLPLHLLVCRGGQMGLGLSPSSAICLTSGEG